MNEAEKAFDARIDEIYLDTSEWQSHGPDGQTLAQEYANLWGEWKKALTLGPISSSELERFRLALNRILLKAHGKGYRVTPEPDTGTGTLVILAGGALLVYLLTRKR